MIRRSLSIATTLLFAAAALLARAAGPDSSAPGGADLENARHQYLGVINGNSVLIRSGPSDNDYPTMRLDKGTQVTVAGIKYNWLKIVPPEGSFSYVSKLYVERHGDGTTGRVTKDNLNVWVGSSLTTVKSAPQCKLARGTEVQILGEADEYLKIKPPAEAYVWVNQNLVAPVRQLTPANDVAAAPAPTTPQPAPSDTTTPENTTVASGSTTQPTTQASETVSIPPMPTSTMPPTSQPAISQTAVNAAETKFDELEASFKAADEQPLLEQPVAELLSGYDKLVANDALPSSMRRIAEVRISALKARNDAKERLVALKQSQDEVANRLKSLRAERTELEERAQQYSVQMFTAVGTLQGSSLQIGGGVLYRLTDPASGRTVCYIRGNDPKYGTMIGQFAGVKGDLTTDSQLALKIVQAKDIVAIDPAKLNKGVSAQIVPPSMIIKASAQAASEQNP